MLWAVAFVAVLLGAVFVPDTSDPFVPSRAAE
jgi:hypothetical protein